MPPRPSDDDKKSPGYPERQPRPEQGGEPGPQTPHQPHNDPDRKPQSEREQ